MTLLILLLSAARPTHAAPASRSPTPAREITPWTVVFRDRPGDCPPEEARAGRCVERVDFADPATPAPWYDAPARDWVRPSPSAGSPLSEAERSGLLEAWRLDLSAGFNRASAVTYARLLEDQACRWRAPRTEAALGPASARRLGPPSALWDELSLRHASFSAPAPERWIVQGADAVRAGAWPGAAPVDLPELGGADPVAEVARLPPQSQLVRFEGRFASALYANQRATPGEIFPAGDAEAFTEQLCPYLDERAQGSKPRAGAGEPRCAALAAPKRPVSSLDALAASAVDRFNTWMWATGRDLVRYGSVEVTSTHTRALGALTAMRWPPRDSSAQVRTAGVNGGSSFQPDEAGPATAPARYARALAAAPNLDAIAEDAMRQGSDLLVLLQRQDPDFGRRAFLDAVDCLLRQRLSETAALPPDPLPALDLASVQRWLGPARSSGDLKLVYRTALQRWVDPATAWTRERSTEQVCQASSPPPAEASALIAQRQADLRWIQLLGRARDSLNGLAEASTPTEVRSRLLQDWQSVLHDHGMPLNERSAGPGQVDPLAVCSEREGAEAQEDPAFRRITLDLYFSAQALPAGTEATAALWDARDDLAFQAIDAGLLPTVHRVVGLPNGEAIYRAEWQLWSGWHLLWGTGLAPEGAPDARLPVLRLAAICSSMTLAQRDLVPTLVRAALLDRGLWPTTPMTRREARSLRLERRREGGAHADLPAPAEVAQAQASLAQPSALRPRPTLPSTTEAGPLGDAAPSGELARVALQAPELRGSELVVFDLVPSDRRRSTAWGRPRSPYLIRSAPVRHTSLRRWVHDGGEPGSVARRRAGKKAVEIAGRGHPRYATVSAWWTHLPADSAPTLLAPARRPGQSVGSAAPRPSWRRIPVWSLDLGGSLDGFTRRFIRRRDPQGGSGSDSMATDLPPMTIGQAVGARIEVTRWGNEDRRAGLSLATTWALAWMPDRASAYYPFALPVGLRLGGRLGLRPTPMWRAGSHPEAARPAWGVSRPDGSANLRRLELQWGIGGALDLWDIREHLDYDNYPGAGGPIAWLPADLALLGSWPPRSGANPFAPYRPPWVFGATLSGALVAADCRDDPGFFPACDLAWQLGVGLRVQAALRRRITTPELR